jgi:thiamine pyrophosphokinase
VDGHTVLVFTGGDREPADLARLLPDAAFVIGADSGVEQALALGHAVDLVVGDLDSIDPRTLAMARASGATVDAHRAEKDHTDLELALRAASARRPERVVVVGGGGGRLDHFLANVLLLGSAHFDALHIEAFIGRGRVTVVTSSITLDGRPGELLTLLAVGGTAEGVRTEGLRYALRGEPLVPGSSRGVSNEFLEPLAVVSLDAGTLLAVQPHYAKD